MEFDIKKFYQWVDDNKMHIILTPGVNNNKVAKLYAGRYNGAYGWVTRELSSGPYGLNYSDFDLVYANEGGSGRSSLFGFAETKEKSVQNLIESLVDPKSLSEEQYTHIENEVGCGYEVRRVEIPKRELFLN